MLVRDAPQAPRGIEVFMLRRNLRSVFVAGAFVFPGGALDDADHAISPGLVDGIDDATASRLLGRDRGGLGFWVAAIRESFEEAGVLLAKDAATRLPAAPDVVERLVPLRASVASGALQLSEILLANGLMLDAGQLRVFGHWITPSPAPRRYDTWFFLAPAPDGHAYRHDDEETIASEWIEPAVALERARREELELIYPTYRTLEGLSRFRTTTDLFAAVDDAWRDPGTALGMVERTGATQVCLPGDELGVDDRVADAVAHSTTAARRAAGAGSTGRHRKRRLVRRRPSKPLDAG
jgi:8-oxo-dGTP pyrophosphatase MutT (NUDIX family)